jgi:hypothetical protein
MAASVHPSAALPSAAPTPAASLWWSSLAAPWLEAQQLQWEGLAAWQRTFAAVQKDIWDQWVCRYGGGVPLDG